jgi:hypothetical protein
LYFRRLGLLIGIPFWAFAGICDTQKSEVQSYEQELRNKYDYKVFSEIPYKELRHSFDILKAKSEALRTCQKTSGQFMDSCRFKLNLVQKDYGETQLVYSEAAMLDDGFQGTCNFYSTKKFKYYVNTLTKKILLTDINGLLGLRSYLDCRLNAEIETNRRINFSRARSGEKYSKFTVIDDWLYPDTRPDQYGEYPLGIQVLSKDKISIAVKEDRIKVNLGKYFIEIENQIGKVVSSNFLDTNFYDNGRCHTKIDSRTQKLIPDFNFQDGIKLKTKIISY